MITMASLGAWPVLAAIWSVLRSSPLIWVAVVGAIVAGGATIKLRGIIHDRNIRAEATAVERAAAEVRRLKAQQQIMMAYVLRGNRIIAARNEDLERQRQETNDLETELTRLRHASTADPRTPVVDGDDPWLRGRATAPARNPPARGR